MSRILFAWLTVVSLVGVASAQGKGLDENVQMSLERYAQLMATAQRYGSGTVTWARGEVQAQVENEGKSLAVTVTARMQATGDGPIQAALLPADVVLTEATISGSQATLLRAAGAHVALLPQAGTFDVRLRYLVAAAEGSDGAPFAMAPLPPLPSAGFSANGPGQLTVWPGAAVSGGNGSLSASLPSAPAFLLTWGTSVGGDTVRSVDFVLTPDELGAGVDVAATYEVRTKGATTAVRLTEASAALVDLREGDKPLASKLVDGWHTAIVEGTGRHVIKVQFRLAIDRSRGQPQVTLHPNQVPIARVEITVPGTRDVTFEPEVPALTKVRGEGDAATTRTVANLPPSDEVTLRWTEARAAPETEVRFNTETYQLLSLQEGVLKSRVITRFEVINGKLRELPMALPEGVIPSKVTGEGIEDWRVYPADGENPRQVRIVLGQELTGKFEVEVDFETVVATEEGTPLDPLPLLKPVKPFYQVGVIALFDGDKVGFAPATAEGFNKAGQDALPPEIRQGLRDNVSQAFRHVGAPGTLTSKVATARTREVRFDTRINTLYEVREGSLTGQASVLVEIKSGRRDKLYISLPAMISAEPRVSGPSFNKMVPAPADFPAGDGRKAYEISFTQALEGAFELDVGFEYTPEKGLGQMSLPDLQVHGAEIASGHIGIAAETGMEVKPGEATDLRKVPVEELPKAVRLRTDLELDVGYQFARAPWKLALDVKRHETVETLTAVADHVWIETNALENGHIVSRATYEIVNDEANYVRLELPEGANVLSVHADGRKVKAVKDEKGAIAIPLPKNRTLRVEVGYEVVRDKLGLLANLGLMAPHADLRTKDVQWMVRVPSRYTAFSVETDLTAAEPYQFQPDPNGAQMELPADGAMRSMLFTFAVHNADEPALAVTLRLAGASGGGTILLLIALLALVLVTRRRALGRPLGAPGAALLALGVAALVAKAAFWQLNLGEALLIAAAIVVVGIWTRRSRRAEA